MRQAAEYRLAGDLAKAITGDQLHVNRKKKEVSFFGRDEGELPWKRHRDKQAAYFSIFGDKEVSADQAKQIMKEAFRVNAACVGQSIGAFRLTIVNRLD